MHTIIAIQSEDLTMAQTEALIDVASAADSPIAAFSPTCTLPPTGTTIRKISAEQLYSLAVDAEDLIIFIPAGELPDDKLLNCFLGTKPKRIFWIHEDGLVRESPLNESDSAKPNMLFIFPGPIVPLNLGSHQRAFNLLRNLRASGHLVDVLIPRCPNREKVASALRSYASNVYFYKNTKRKVPWHRRAMRGLDKRWRKTIGLDETLPDLYSERARTKPVESVARMANSLFLAKNYSVVLVSYAWMMGSLRHMQPFRDQFKVVCDTHDVQFFRNESNIGRWGRLCSSLAHEKKLELDDLRKADAVLAISKSDEELLKTTLPKARVVRVSPGFDYAASELKRRANNAPVNFGFIGGSMAANVQAVNYILENWWPAIREFSPDSKLFLAGSVSRNEYLQRLTFFDENIVKLGFVDDLGDFYRQIDVALNPVVVAGGLNFKSVEAVFYGKHLLTNPLGKRCLGDSFPCEVIESAENLIEVVTRIEANAFADLNKRRQLQQMAIKQFGNRQACHDIVSHLSFVG